MRMAPLHFFLTAAVCVFCAGSARGAGALAAEVVPAGTNDPAIADTQHAYVQLQQQIRALQLALERSQQDAQAAARRNADDVTASIQLLEQSLNLRRDNELETMQRNNEVTWLIAGTFATVVLFVMLLSAYFQWRVANRLAELSPPGPSAMALTSGRPPLELAAGGGPSSAPAADAQTNARLLRVMGQLQQRILKYEQAARAPQKK